MEAAKGEYYIAYDNDIVHNTETNLEWVAGPDKDTTWDDAKEWVENLSTDGGGWHMPTINELKSLYQYGVGSHNMTSLLKTIGWFVWSDETRNSSSAWGFNFYFGKVDWGGCDGSYYARGFAVRSRRQ